MKTPFSRRRAIQIGAASAFTAAIPLSGAKMQAGRVPRVDAHLHCFAGKDDSRFPYHERAPYKPEQPATPEHLLRSMQEAGVDYAIVVHPEPYQDDHRYLEHCLTLGKGKLKGTLLLFADREGSLEKMPELCRKLDVVAVRVHAYAPDRLPPFGKPELKRLWQMATDHSLAVQLHFEPRYAPGFEPLIREFANTKVIIDHMGRPFQGTPAEHAVVLGWAKHDNTIMKLSSIPDAKMYPHRGDCADRSPTHGRLGRRSHDLWRRLRPRYDRRQLSGGVREGPQLLGTFNGRRSGQNPRGHCGETLPVWGVRP